MILAIVNRMEGTVDRLAGEQLKFDPGPPCVSFETTDKRKQNDMLMTTLHEEAHTTCVK